MGLYRPVYIRYIFSEDKDFYLGNFIFPNINKILFVWQNTGGIYFMKKKNNSRHVQLINLLSNITLTFLINLVRVWRKHTQYISKKLV